MYEVRESPLHGKGLFATERIPKGRLIGRYEGQPTRRNARHVLWMQDEDGQWHGLRVLNDMRFVNHSRRPNAVVYGTEIFAKKAIRPGEEITFDYGKDFADL